MSDLRRTRLAGFKSLLQARAEAFRKELYPYFRYVFQSGFGLVLSGIGITLVTGYVRLLNDMPDNWPSDIVGAAVLTLLAWYAPLRTYFQPADTVFALPLESGALEGVVRPKVRRGMLASALRMAAAFGAFAPLYSLAPATASAAAARSLPLLGLALGLFGAWNAYAAWTERRIAAGAWRAGLRTARYAAAAAVVAGLLLKPFAWAVAFGVLCAGAHASAARLQIRHALPWDRLIHEELAARRRWMRFLGWFVDVPSETDRPAKRAWIVWAAGLLRWRRDSAWTYLYAKTLLRSDTFGAFWRWNALLIVIALFVRQSVLDAVVFAIAVLVGGMQLTELARVRFAANAATVPLPPERRPQSAAAVARTAGITAAALQWLAAALPDRPAQPGLWWIALALALLWSGGLLPRRIRRAMNKTAEDDD
ncbi:ABC transporter permease [Cohnella thermotolerans]|uniref:ABC transporter permease n=1 Tax=Cohnella thermotolerans TaxID=329858 RepID=UPI0004230761|nr:ABC transporter permease [Cohnella thermotolerans]